MRCEIEVLFLLGGGITSCEESPALYLSCFCMSADLFAYVIWQTAPWQAYLVRPRWLKRRSVMTGLVLYVDGDAYADQDTLSTSSTGPSCNYPMYPL